MKVRPPWIYSLSRLPSQGMFTMYTLSAIPNPSKRHYAAWQPKRLTAKDWQLEDKGMVKSRVLGLLYCDLCWLAEDVSHSLTHMPTLLAVWVSGSFTVLYAERETGLSLFLYIYIQQSSKKSPESLTVVSIESASISHNNFLASEGHKMNKHVLPIDQIRDKPPRNESCRNLLGWITRSKAFVRLSISHLQPIACRSQEVQLPDGDRRGLRGP